MISLNEYEKQTELALRRHSRSPKKKKNTSLAEIGRNHGYASGTIKNALDKHYPAAELIIARALGLQLQNI